jgi:hypothetical protein
MQQKFTYGELKTVAEVFLEIGKAMIERPEAWNVWDFNAGLNGLIDELIEERECSKDQIL